MKLIYTADNIAEAHIVAGLLRANGIDCHVGGHYLQGGVGELMSMGFANLYVCNADIATAGAVIADYDKQRHSELVGAADQQKKHSLPHWLLLACILLAAALIGLR